MIKWNVAGNSCYLHNVANGGIQLGGTGKVYPDWYKGYQPSGGIYVPSSPANKGVAMIYKALYISDAGYIYQDIERPEAFRDKDVNYWLWVFAREASVARIAIYDGTTTYSSYHSGGGAWEKLPIARTIDKNADDLEVRIYHEGTGKQPIFVSDAWLTTETTEYGYTRYTAYEIVEMIVNSIGGTLTCISRSTLSTELYPKMNIQFGTSGLDVINQIMQLLPDVIRWYGNDAYWLNPQTTDDPIYFYVGPTPS